MTDEQIKRNALKAEKEHGKFNYQYQGEAFNKGYLAGAHSRDEEIEELKKELEDMTKLKNFFASSLDIYDKDNKELQDELNLLRNPWVDVNNESNRPKKGKQIIIAFDDNARTILKYTDKDLFEIWNAHHWMPIPEIQKERYEEQ